MAAYGALVSLSHVLDRILHPSPTHQFFIPRKQMESLREKICFFVDFLETYSSRGNKEIEDLGTRIAEAAYAAEDIIESNVIDQILAINGEKTSTLLCEGMQTLLEKFLSIEKKLMRIRDKEGMEDLPPKISTTGISTRPLPGGKTTMVGFDERLIEVMSQLTTDECSRRIIPIVGMGGIGKTTLATAVYNHPFIIEHFHVHAWVTVSQEYNVRELLLGLLHQISTEYPNEREKSDYQLGELLHKVLFERKYLIVMDDMWNIEAWDKVKRFIPANNSGSRILLTTRLLKLAIDIGSSSPYEMKFLDEEQSWYLLCKKVFGQGDCPVALEKIGKDIAKRCRGLPLALAVIGGLLAKSERKSECWKSLARDVTSTVNNEDDQNFMKLLSLSYIHLPIHLKPCFLYLAAFPEDFDINVSRLVRLWVAEGIIQLKKTESLEEVAEEYLEDLVGRNLVLVRKRGSSGKMKTCNIHDLLRDLCMREAQKDKFLFIRKLDSPNISPHMESERRLSFHYRGSENKVWGEALLSAKLKRSLLGYCTWRPNQVSGHKWRTGQIAPSFRLLRVLDAIDGYIDIEILQLINSRYVACTWHMVLNSRYISRLWNLQTLVLDGNITLPAQIWQMSQIRHIKITEAYLRDPPGDSQNIVVLENLQTLARVKHFKCTKHVVDRIPNIKKLGIAYGFLSKEYGPYYLSNLVHLHKLESLRVRGDEKLWGKIAFPSSIKKLILSFCNIPWEEMSMIGSLPNLEVLKLFAYAVKGHEWYPKEGEFCRLKFLLVYGCKLEIWGADNTNFPCLESLFLRNVGLMEIPMDFAEISTLQVIGIYPSSSPLWTSAKEISEQRENLGYEALQIL